MVAVKITLGLGVYLLSERLLDPSADLPLPLLGIGGDLLLPLLPSWAGDHVLLDADDPLDPLWRDPPLLFGDT